MHIHRLHLTITEQDLNALARRHLPKEQPVEDLKLRLAPEGLVVNGVFPFFINVSFEILWALTVSDGKVCARLANFKAMGIPGPIFKSAVLKVIGDAGKKQTWLRIDGDTLWLDLDSLLLSQGLTGQTNLTSIACQAGQLLLEAAAQS